MPQDCEIGTSRVYSEPTFGHTFTACDVPLKLGDSGHIIPAGLKETGYYDK